METKKRLRALARITGKKQPCIFVKLCVEITDGKRHKHVFEIFQSLVPKIERRGYNKTAEQIKLKLKNLKLAYFKCKQDNNVSGAISNYTHCLQQHSHY